MANAFFYEQIKVSAGQKEQLQKLVPKFTPLMMDKLTHEIEDLATFKVNFQRPLDISPSKLKNELESITDSLDAAVRFFEEDSMSSVTGVLETYHGWAKQQVTHLNDPEHGFLSSLKLSLAALQDYQGTKPAEEPVSPFVIKKGAPVAMQNAYTIRKLAEFFQQNVEMYKVSAEENTAFYKVVRFILNEIFDLDIEDPKKQIKNALKDVQA